MAKKWMPYHWQIPLAEEEIPMDKGGFRTVVIDVKKVINGLRSIKTYLASQAIETTDSFAREGFIESQKDIDDAIAMLKEQEAVVHPEPSCEMTYITNCCCDLCGVQLIREDNFCRCCGKRIEWEGR